MFCRHTFIKQGVREKQGGGRVGGESLVLTAQLNQEKNKKGLLPVQHYSVWEPDFRI